MFSFSIRRKLLIALISISIIPIIFLGIIFHIEGKKDMVFKINTLFSSNITETARRMSDRFRDIEITLDGVMVQDEVQDNLDLPKSSRVEIEEDISSAIQDRVYENYLINSYINYFEIFDDDNNYFYNYGYKNMDKSLRPFIRFTAYRLAGRTYYQNGPGENEILISRAINKGFTLKPMGYMVLSLPNDYFSEAYKGINTINPDIKTMVMDKYGMVLSSNDNELHGLRYSDKKVVQRITMYGEASSYFETEYMDEKYIISYANIENTSYNLVCLIPYSYINEYTNKMDRLIAYIVAISVIIAICIAIVIARAIFRPLNRLVQVMKDTKDGTDLSIKLEYNKEDEIGYLVDNFNDMLHRIQNLIIQLEEEEKEKREAELNMLQAQINPHFLFNVLNSLKWTAMMSQSYSVSDGIDALANLLRDTISNKNEFVTLGREIENIEHYIVIQRMRYGESFVLENNLDQAMLMCKIPKLLLQPIVENSIIHGFEGIDYPGVITVNGVIEDGDLILEIVDNGKGLSDDLIDSISREGYHSLKQLSSIGLSNVEQRIRLHYGEDYGLTIGSSNQGTRVTIKIPYDRGDVCIERL